MLRIFEAVSILMLGELLKQPSANVTVDKDDITIEDSEIEIKESRTVSQGIIFFSLGKIKFQNHFSTFLQ